MYLFDTFSNFLSGLGMPGRDKSTGFAFTAPIWTRDQLEAAFRSDWIARKAITIPAHDATREWRAWQAEGNQIEKLEETEDRLHLQLKLQQALVKARLYGGCCMLIGVDGSMEKELDPETITKDGLKFVHVLAPHQLVIEDLEKDISNPYYGQPKHYILRDESKPGVALDVKIHPSRMVRLIGLDTPDPMANFGWGDPLMQVINDAVAAAGTVTQSIAALVQEAKFDVIKIPGLTEIFSTANGTNRLIKRFAEANVAKSVINAVVLDAEEEWQRIGANFEGMPEILQMYLQIAAGAADIPATRFLGRSPAGLNATGDSDLQNYYDRVASDQELRLTPALEKLDKAIKRSALGKDDPNIFYNWNSLWQMSDSEKADVANKKATVAKLDADAGLVPFEALVRGRVNQLIEDGTYPGIEAGIEEAIANAELEREEQAAMEQQMMEEGGGPDGEGGPPGFGGGGGPPKPGNDNEGMDGELEKKKKKKAVGDAGNWDPAKHPHGAMGRWATTGGDDDDEGKPEAGDFGKKSEDELGPGYSKEATIVKGVIHTANVYDAVMALSQDRAVELSQPKQISTLIKALGEVSATMVEAGEKAPVFDLCKVTVKGTNLFCADHKGIPRIQMPQMDDVQTKKFVKKLESMGYGTSKESEKSSNLRATQAQLDGAKVNKFYARIKKDKDFKGDDKRLIVSRDDYVLDGHHHWAAQIAADAMDNKLGDHKTKVTRVDIDIITLYHLAMKFTKGKGAKGVGDALVEATWSEDALRRWDESKATRVPAGQGGGGRFGTVGTGALAKKERNKRQTSALARGTEGMPKTLVRKIELAMRAGNVEAAKALLEEARESGASRGKVEAGETEVSIRNMIRERQQRKERVQREDLLQTLIREGNEVAQGGKSEAQQVIKRAREAGRSIAEQSDYEETIRREMVRTGEIHPPPQSKEEREGVRQQAIEASRTLTEGGREAEARATLERARQNRISYPEQQKRDLEEAAKPKEEPKKPDATKAESKPGESTADDFAKAGIEIADFRRTQVDAIKTWNEKIGMTPKDFKAKFVGGLNVTMRIDVDADNQNKFHITGLVKSDDGTKTMGSYERKISPQAKSAYSAYFKLEKKYQGGDHAKRMLRGNVETYDALGITEVKVGANIDVGGYAWAKYGYVPTQESWGQLRQTIAARLGGGRSSSSSSDNTDKMEAEEWSMLGDDRQREVFDRWADDSFSEFRDSEINNWQESGQPMEQAKTDIVDRFNSMDDADWTDDAIDEVRDALEANSERVFPYTNEQLRSAMSIEYSSRYEDGNGDMTVSWNDEKLTEHAPPPDDPNQKKLPGVERPTAADYLTDDMRASIETRMQYHFERKAQDIAGDAEAPDYITDSVREYQEEYWDQMDDSARYDYAERYDMHMIEIERDEEDEDDADEGDAEVPDVPKTETDRLLDLLKSSNPRTMWEISDHPRGKELLLNTSWQGRLDLNDSSSRDRFTKYVNKKKEKKVAA